MSDKTDHPAVPEAFARLGIRPSVLRGLAEAKYETPSDIQALLIPRALTGVDLLGQARTGTGKTASFAIPLLCMLQRGMATQGIILVPTRELAVQVESELQRLGQFTPLRTVAVYGGQKISAQMKFLKHGPEILVGTPGRVMDLLERRIIDFDNLRIAVLDEVDRMLDIGFRDDIRKILAQAKKTPRNEADPQPEAGEDAAGASTRPSLQTIFVSATFSDEIERLARRYMNNPEKLIAPGADEKPTVDKVEQYYLSVQPWDKYKLLRALIEQETPELAIIFCKTKRGADKLAKKLHADGIECREIHGNLAQNKRDRVMKGFRSGKFNVLVATDLASRGIDVADISHIVNYDIPDDPEIYVHRVGRTARMGAKGKAFTFVLRDQGDQLTRVERLINMEVPQAQVEGFVPAPTPNDWDSAGPRGGGGGNRGRSSGRQGGAPARQPAAASQPAAPAAGGNAPADANARKLPPRTLGSKIPSRRRRR